MRFIVVGRYVAALALLAVVPAAAHGQNPSTSAPTKVAYVNTREILKQTPGYAQAESLYNKEVDSYQDQMQKLRASLDSSAADFERQSAMLNATQKAAKRKALDDQRQKAEQQAQDMQQKMSSRERELLEPIQSRINSVIEGIRAAGGYAIVFDVSAPNSNILTADRSLDLTEKVIQQLK